jgi:hypothetical protein
MLSSIHIITQEEEIGAGRESAHFEHSDKVGVLPMNITHDLDRGFQLEKGWLV